MVSESSVTMASLTLPVSLEESFEKDIEALLREEQHSLVSDRERELNIYRSGSAPPTVEGSRNAIGSLFGRAEVHGFDGQNAGDLLSEEEMRSHLAYVSYYYSNENLNPRLPPPLVSKEDWRATQRLGFGGSALGGIGDRSRKQSVEGDGSSSSLFPMQSSLPAQGGKESVENGGSRDWCERGRGGVIVLPEIGLGARRRSFADVLQEDLNHSNTGVVGHLSHPASQNAFDNAASPVTLSGVHLTQFNNNSQTIGAIHSGRTPPELVRVQSLVSKLSLSSASPVDLSLPRSRTADPQIIGRSSSPCLPAVGSRACDADSKMSSNVFGGIPSQMTDYVGGVPSQMTDYADVAATLSGLNLGSKTGDGENLVQCQFPYESNSCDAASISGLLFNELSKNTGLLKDDISTMASNDQTFLQKSLLSNNLSKKIASMRSSRSAVSNGHYQTGSLFANFAESNPNTYLLNHGIPMKNQLDTDAAAPGSSEYVNMNGSTEVSRFQASMTDPFYAQYLQRASGPTSPFLGNLNDPSLGGSFRGASHMDLTGYQNAYLEALLVQQKLQYGGPLTKHGGLSNGFNGMSALGLGLPSTKHPISGTLLSPLGPGSPLRQNDRRAHLPSMLQSATGLSEGSWNIANGIAEGGFASTLLEELKNNKTRSFELADIVGHVVEFSADQYGSRFIQQKLETASFVEKNEIFPEILPHARALMTDVFGNYVIQKFFEHGTDIQRNQFASQLIGHVLPLSLQMYGCRVIQKALEVFDVEQQTQVVSELDGSVMKCVWDQNGNHVIQKCIECVPQERIQFIISAFYGQVVPLSTHPYGCRVIQRVLEHCNDAKTQSIMMDEILQSVCTLALDQYGNYVVQHVLQYGKTEERSAIISKLSGQIVKMSQQKFASNVIEKCLTHGNPEERLLLIHEMLGSTEENEPLQAMMKDQFANYVVQKVLETCDDRNRELILSRIKVHLNALKRYTYGKHIVARVEKLIAAGERRMGMTKSS